MSSFVSSEGSAHTEWLARAPVWFGRTIVRVESPIVTIRASALGDDARPTADWPE